MRRAAYGWLASCRSLMTATLLRTSRAGGVRKKRRRGKQVTFTPIRIIWRRVTTYIVSRFPFRRCSQHIQTSSLHKRAPRRTHRENCNEYFFGPSWPPLQHRLCVEAHTPRPKGLGVSQQRLLPLQRIKAPANVFQKSPSHLASKLRWETLTHSCFLTTSWELYQIRVWQKP